MKIHLLDWSIIILFFIVFIIIGLISSKTSSKNSKEYFLSGRNMPWWLLGISMVATTFSADTPNLVANIVREKVFQVIGPGGLFTNWNVYCLFIFQIMEKIKSFDRFGVL